MRHTAAPWRVIEGLTYFERMGELRPAYVVRTNDGNAWIASAWLDGIGVDAMRANARLIAAAPDMLIWLCNVATDEQLDAPVPKLGGRTGRDILRGIDNAEG